MKRKLVLLALSASFLFLTTGCATTNVSPLERKEFKRDVVRNWCSARCMQHYRKRQAIKEAPINALPDYVFDLGYL